MGHRFRHHALPRKNSPKIMAPVSTVSSTMAVLRGESMTNLISSSQTSRKYAISISQPLCCFRNSGTASRTPMVRCAHVLSWTKGQKKPHQIRPAHRNMTHSMGHQISHTRRLAGLSLPAGPNSSTHSIGT